MSLVQGKTKPWSWCGAAARSWRHTLSRKPIRADASFRFCRGGSEPEGCIWVVVDVIGIGYNFALHLADLGFPVVQFNAGHRPIDTERFTNLKAEAYWQLREHMEKGAVSGLNDLETEAQLSAILYRPTSSGRTEIESKEEARKRGQSSPDRAEALVMAFLKVVLREETVVFSDRVTISQF